MKMREQNWRVLFPLILSIPAGVQHRPVSDSEPPPPRRPGPTQGGCWPGCNQGSRADQIKKDLFLRPGICFLFILFRCFALVIFFLNKMIWRKPKGNDMGTPREGVRLARDGENKACGIHSPMPPLRSQWPNRPKPSMRLSLPCSLTPAWAQAPHPPAPIPSRAQGPLQPPQSLTPPPRHKMAWGYHPIGKGRRVSYCGG